MPNTQMLASVVSPNEADIVLSAGVEIVDLKNPAEGALGALPLEVVRAVVDMVDHRAMVSATIGDQPMEPALLVSKTKEMLNTGVDVVKIGFFGESAHEACLQALQEVAEQGAKLIAVLFADMSPNLTLLNKISAAGFYGVMLDTAKKDGRHLLDHYSLEMLKAFVVKANSLGLQAGLAGALARDHVQVLLDIKPSYLGFRSALCDQSKRTATLNLRQVSELVKLMRGQFYEETAPGFMNNASYALI